MNNVLGTCSICGGAVTLPAVWFGVVSPVPTCSRCGATAKKHTHVIDMQPRAPNNARDTAPRVIKTRDE